MCVEFSNSLLCSHKTRKQKKNIVKILRAADDHTLYIKTFTLTSNAIDILS